MGPSRCNRKAHLSRSTVACRPVPALPFPALPPGPARRPLATRHSCLAAVAGLPSRLRAATTPHPAPPSGSPRESAPHERDLRYIVQARGVVNNTFITYLWSRYVVMCTPTSRSRRYLKNFRRAGRGRSPRGWAYAPAEHLCVEHKVSKAIDFCRDAARSPTEPKAPLRPAFFRGDRP